MSTEERLERLERLLLERVSFGFEIEKAVARQLDAVTSVLLNKQQVICVAETSSPSEDVPEGWISLTAAMKLVTRSRNTIRAKCVSGDTDTETETEIKEIKNRPYCCLSITTICAPRKTTGFKS